MLFKNVYKDLKEPVSYTHLDVYKRQLFMLKVIVISAVVFIKSRREHLDNFIRYAV